MKAQDKSECLIYDSIKVNGVSLYKVTEGLHCKICYDGILQSGKASLTDLKRATELKAAVYSPDTTEDLEILSFRLTIERSGGLITSLYNTGNVLSQEIKSAIGSISIGNKIIIDNIFIRSFPTYVSGMLPPINIIVSNKSAPIPCQRINNNKFLVFFSPDVFELSKETIEELNKVVIILKNHPNKKAKITGFADAKGEIEKNIKLSSKRAEAVANFLISNGISEERINFSGGGVQSPLEKVKSDRRVEIIVL